MNVNKPVFAKVKEHRDIIRDMNSKALLNIDREAYEAHKSRRIQQQKTQNLTPANQLNLISLWF